MITANVNMFETSIVEQLRSDLAMHALEFRNALEAMHASDHSPDYEQTRLAMKEYLIQFIPKLRECEADSAMSFGMLRDCIYEVLVPEIVTVYFNFYRIMQIDLLRAVGQDQQRPSELLEVSNEQHWNVVRFGYAWANVAQILKSKLQEKKNRDIQTEQETLQEISEESAAICIANASQIMEFMGKMDVWNLLAQVQWQVEEDFPGFFAMCKAVSMSRLLRD